jgi:glutathione S-transferase
MSARLYVLPGSHPSMTARLMLERKDIEFKRVDLLPAVHKRALRVLRFEGDTVPALKLDGRRIQGTREIARVLDEMVPEPPLFPSDPARRAKVEEAERWGDEELQSPVRRVSWWALRHDRSAVRSFLEGARLGLPIWLASRTSAPFIRASARINDATDEAVEADLAALPALLDHVDALIADGLLGSEQPTAADYQIAPSVRLLMTFEDLRPSLEVRAAGRLAQRLVPDFPGEIPPVLPPDWLNQASGPGVAAAT